MTNFSGSDKWRTLLGKCGPPLLINLLYDNYHCVEEACQIVRNWVAFCAKDQNTDFAWDVEQNYTLADSKHMASILRLFLKSSASLHYISLFFVLLCISIMKGISESGIERPAWDRHWDFLACGTSSHTHWALPDHTFPLGHGSAPRCLHNPC